MEKLKTAFPWVLSGYIAFVFVQSLFFKFSGHEQSVAIFQTLEDWSGLPFEPEGRLFIGGSELFVSALLLIPALRFLGALGTFFIITGAIYFHALGPLGIEVNNDGGVLFGMAVGVWVSSVVLMVTDFHKAKELISRFL